VTEETPIVYVVDDDPSVCAATKRVLASAGYQVQTFHNTTELFAHGRPEVPCCLLLDLQMPDEDGLRFQARLTASGIRVPIVFITAHGDIAKSVHAMKAGADDFLPKPYDRKQLIAAVEQALAADATALDSNRNLVELKARYESLTEREREVFATVTCGLLNKQVGEELGITEKTVKVHRARVMEKMQAEALPDLVRMADLLAVHCAGASEGAGMAVVYPRGSSALLQVRL